MLSILTTGCTKELDPKFTTVPRPQTAAEKAAAYDDLDTIEAEVVAVARQTWPRIIRSQGSLESDQISTVASEVDGQVIELRFDIGDQVKAGDVLARIDPADYKLLVEQSKARLIQAKSAIGLKATDSTDMLEPLNAPPSREARAVWDEAKQAVARIRQLYEQKAIADIDLDAAEAAERVAEARYASALNGVREKMAAIQLQQSELEIAEQQLSRTEIIAPIDGRIQSRTVALGNFISPGNPLFTIAVTKVLRYRSSVPEKYALNLSIGQTVRVSPVGRIDTRETIISRIAPTLDQQTRSLYFEAYVPNENELIRPGLFAESEIVLDPTAQAIVLPNTALIRFAGIDKVWKVKDGVAQEVVVKVGRRAEDYSEIVEGIEIDDIVLKDATRGRVAKVEYTSSIPVAEQTTDNKANVQIPAEPIRKASGPKDSTKQTSTHAIQAS